MRASAGSAFIELGLHNKQGHPRTASLLEKRRYFYLSEAKNFGDRYNNTDHALSKSVINIFLRKFLFIYGKFKKAFGKYELVTGLTSHVTAFEWETMLHSHLSLARSVRKHVPPAAIKL